MSEATQKIELKIGERIAALKILNGFKGDIVTLKSILDDVKQFPVTDEEWKKAVLVKTPAENGQENWSWKDEVVVKEITLQAETSKFLKDEIKRKSDASEITVADAALITLNEKLK